MNVIESPHPQPRLTPGLFLPLPRQSQEQILRRGARVILAIGLEATLPEERSGVVGQSDRRSQVIGGEPLIGFVVAIDGELSDRSSSEGEVEDSLGALSRVSE